MAELADAQDSGSCFRLEGAGSSPVVRTNKRRLRSSFFITPTDLRQFAIVGKQCLQPAHVQLTASKERRKRVAFAEIVRSGHSKQTRHAVTRAMHVGATAPFV